MSAGGSAIFSAGG